MATESKVCQECGTPLTAESPHGLCPQCLLKRGLASSLSRPSAAEEKTVIETESPRSTGIALPREGQLFGGYQIVRLLGKGGMGAVYEAEHLESGRRVALKVLNHSLDSAEARKRFLREGRLAASVNHPNSVYVFGTEEVGGVPVISMELAPGGTLKDRVQNSGPRPVSEAVDGILQIIDGLEAAQAVGVLHRDVKPSNVFVDSDGKVKVGDFGLSISTLARADTNLSLSGAFLGTPAYSSPEQLRGDELDLRSDIYAVGVTLYYLLTGKTPFEESNLVKLLAIVLERPAESPAKWRPEIPKELAQVVLRCLAKQKEHRFKSYEELRQALWPFSSTVPAPARPGLRFCACLVDNAVLILATTAFMIGVLPWLSGSLNPETGPAGWIAKFGFVWTMLYYAIPEGLWGASIGKALCGLRVLDRNRNAPGVPRALLRAFVYLLMGQLVAWFFPNAQEVKYGQPGFWPATALAVAVVAGPFLVLFSTARRKNGFAGLHDLLSRTRVVRRMELQTRPALAVVEEIPTDAESLAQVGPYYVLAALDKSAAHELLLGFDTRLLRKVWIRKLPPGAPTLDASRQALGRPARLRWLSGKRLGGECWDAYEAPSGQPLLQKLPTPQPWRMVRHWLHDLAEELAASQKDRSMPEKLALDRIWITNDGRAKLLEFAAPCPASNQGGTESGIAGDVRSVNPPTPSPLPGGEPATVSSEPPQMLDDHAAQLYLKQAAASALTGRVVPLAEIRERTVAGVLPLHARDFLNTLPLFSSLEQMVRELNSLLNQVASVSLRTRLGLIFGCAAPLLFAALIILPIVLFFLHYMTVNFPGLQNLARCLERIETLKKLENQAANESHARERQAFEVYVAAHFRDSFTNLVEWSGRLKLKRTDGGTLEEFRGTADRILAAHPNPSSNEVAAATSVVKPFLDQRPPDPPVTAWRILRGIGPVSMYGLAWLVAVPGLIAALAFRGGLLVHMLGIAFVTGDGLPASRWRLLIRSLATWAPLALLPILSESWDDQPAAALALILLVAGAGVSLWRPQRGLADYIAGTWLVPR